MQVRILQQEVGSALCQFPFFFFFHLYELLGQLTSSLLPSSCNHHVLRNEGFRKAGRFCLSLQTPGESDDIRKLKRTSLSTMGKTWFSLVKPDISFLIVLNEKKSRCPESANSSQCCLPMSTAEKQDKREPGMYVMEPLLLDVIDRHIEKDF